jgi:hypothetical protein
VSESKQRHHLRPEAASALPYWKRAHHDWRFWVALFLMFLAMAVYVLSDNLAFVRHP